MKENFIQKYSIKAAPCIVIWFRVIWELMTKDFDKEVLVKYNLLNLPIVTQLSQKTISATRYTKTVL